jgi:hypothetical protein
MLVSVASSCPTFLQPPNPKSKWTLLSVQPLAVLVAQLQHEETGWNFFSENAQRTPDCSFILFMTPNVSFSFSSTFLPLAFRKISDVCSNHSS